MFGSVHFKGFAGAIPAALIAAAVIAPTSIATAQGIPCRYHAQPILPPACSGAAYVFASAISPNGRYVCGYWFCNAGADRPFVWIAPEVSGQPGTFVPISIPGFVVGYANDVADNGTVVGRVDSATLGARGFVYNLLTGASTLLPPINLQGICGATGVNSAGEVCGYRSIGSKSDPVNPQTAFRWTAANGFTDLGSVNGMATGATDIASDGAIAVIAGLGLATYVWDGNRVENVGILAGADAMTPNAIATNRRVVGAASFIAGPAYWAGAFDFKNHLLTSLPPLDSAHGSSTALDVTDSGFVGGGCAPIESPASLTPCIWAHGRVSNVNDLLATKSSFLLFFVSAVSNNGQLVCQGQDYASQSHRSWLLWPDDAVLGDTNCDERVDVDDFVAVILDWHEIESSADVNLDGIVNVEDMIIVINEWTITE